MSKYGDRNHQFYFFAAVACLSAIFLSESPAFAAKARQGVLNPVALLDFWVVPGQARTLRWTTEKAPSAEFLDYVVVDYHDSEIAKGRAVLNGKEITLAVTLPQGYYEVKFPQLKESFGLVSLITPQGQADKFFAMNLILTHVNYGTLTKDKRNEILQVLRHAGIGQTRELINWWHLNPEKDKWLWDDSLHYDEVAEAYREQKMPMSLFFCGTPKYVGADPGGKNGAGAVGNFFPTDLVSAYDAWQTFVLHWHDALSALEVYNEPDITGGGSMPGDHYAPMAKAMNYLFTENRLKATLVGGVFAGYFYTTDSFLDNCARNGLFEQVDTVSFHNYSSAMQLEAEADRFRSWAKKYGKASIPMWITECGKTWPLGPERPPLAQAQSSALQITMKAVEARACGIESYFPFRYVFYEESGTINYGMTGREETPLRSLAAYAFAITAFPGMEYAGDLKGAPAGLKRARVFRNGDRALLALFSDKIAANESVDLNLAEAQAFGIDGRKLELANGKCPLSDGLTYITCPWSSVAALVDTETLAARLLADARGAKPKRAAPCAVIMQPLARGNKDNPGLPAPSKRGYSFSFGDSGAKSCGIRIHNLSRQEREVRLTFKNTQGKIKAVDSPEKTVKLPALSSQEVYWYLQIPADMNPFAACEFAFDGKLDDGTTLSPVVEDIFFTADAQALVKGASRQQALPFKADKWVNYISSGGKTDFSLTKDNNWRMQVDFPKGQASSSYWVYPKLALPKEMKLQNGFSLLCRYMLEKKADARVILYEKDGSAYSSGPTLTALSTQESGQWQTATLLPENFFLGSWSQDENARLDLDQVATVAFGFQGGDTENSLEVSDFIVLYP